MARSSDTTRCDVASDHTDIQFLPSRGRSSRSVCRRSPALRPNGREHAPSSRRRWNTSDHFLLCRKRLTDDCERPSRAFEAISMTFFSPRPLSMRPATNFTRCLNCGLVIHERYESSMPRRGNERATKTMASNVEAMRLQGYCPVSKTAKALLIKKRRKWVYGVTQM